MKHDNMPHYTVSIVEIRHKSGEQPFKQQQDLLKCFTPVCWQFVSGLQSSRNHHTEGEGLVNEVFTQRWPKLFHLAIITLHDDIQHV